jgi:hypothetical protein
MFRLLPLTLFAAATVATGCVTVHHVERPTTVEALWEYGPSMTVVYDAVQPLPAVYRATPIAQRAGAVGPSGDDVDLRMPRRGAVVAPHVLGDHLDGLWVESGKLIKLGDVQAIEVKNRWVSGLVGLAIGTLVGLGFGAIAGTGETSDGPCTDDLVSCLFTVHRTASEKASADRVGGAIGGGLTGLLIGVLVGHIDRYEF